jgi:hypothetical protein
MVVLNCFWERQGLESQRDLSEIRREPSSTALCLCFCTLHTNEIPRTDPLVQVDYVRVADLDIGGEQIGHLRDQSGHHFGARRQVRATRGAIGHSFRPRLGAAFAE